MYFSWDEFFFSAEMLSREEGARYAAESLLSGSPGSQMPHIVPQHPQQQHFVHPDYGSFSPVYGRMYPRLTGSVQSLFDCVQCLNKVYQFVISPGPTSPSLEFYNEELLAGLRLGGQMSSVRRFFCLFLTFDLLFTFLMWFTCIMVCVKFCFCVVSSHFQFEQLAGNGDVVHALTEEVLHYNVHTSIFDIVVSNYLTRCVIKMISHCSSNFQMASACRFTVLLLFYALLYINHWSIIAVCSVLN